MKFFSTRINTLYFNQYPDIYLFVLLFQLSDNSDERRLEDVFKKHLRLSNFSIGGTDLYTNKAGADALTINGI